VTPEDYPSLLFDAAALWEMTSSEGLDELVQTATSALVLGVDMPSIRYLAGETDTASYWALRPYVEAMLDALGLDYPRGQAGEVAGMRSMCRRLLRGAISEQRLTTWVLHSIGWEGTSEAREFLELESAYSEVDALELDVKALDVAVHREAERLLSVT